MINCGFVVDYSGKKAQEMFDWKTENLKNVDEVFQEAASLIAMINIREKKLYEHIAKCTNMNYDDVVKILTPMISEDIKRVEENNKK